MKLPQVITQCEDLQPLLSAIETCSEIAIDTEADSLFSYRARVCLIQIGTPGHNWVVDPLADLDLDDLFDLLETKALLLHGCDYDLRMLSMEYDFHAQSVWDTMIAARYLSEPQIGLAALVLKNFGISLDKSNQKANWAQRPIPEKMLIYATEDTHYLAEIANRQRAELAKQGKLDWTLEHCQMVLEHSTIDINSIIEDIDPWRIKGSNHLNPREMALLRTFWQWREDIADKRNVPTFKVITNERILEYCHRFANLNSLVPGQLSTLPRNIHGTQFEELLHRLNEALALPIQACPLPAPRHIPPPAPNAQLMEKLKDIRDTMALRLNLDPSLVANRQQLVNIGLSLDKGIQEALNHSELMQWQQGLWKEELKKL